MLDYISFVYTTFSKLVAIIRAIFCRWKFELSHPLVESDKQVEFNCDVTQLAHQKTYTVQHVHWKRAS